MTLNELYELFDQAVKQNQGRYVVLGRALLEQLDTVIGPIGEASFTVNRPSLSRTPAAVTLAGTGSYRSEACDVLLLATPAGTGLNFTLTLQMDDADGWTFGRAFDNLPPYYAHAGGVLRPAPSFLAQVRIRRPAFISAGMDDASADLVKGLNFRGDLIMEGPMEAYRYYFGDGPFPLAGPVRLRDAEPPLMELRAEILDRSAAVGGTRLESIALRLAVRPGADAPQGDEPEPVSLLEITGLLSIGSSNPIKALLAAPLLQGDYSWPLRLELGDYSEQLQGGLAQLAESLFGVRADGLALPPGLSFLGSIYLSDVEIGLLPPASGGLAPGISYISAVVRSNGVWKPPVPFISLSELGAGWCFTFGGESGAPFVMATVYGTVAFGAVQSGTAPGEAVSENGVSLEVSASYPDFLIEGRLSKGEVIDLGQAFTWFFGAPGPASGLKITRLEFTAGLAEQSFTGQATITTGWELALGAVTFNLAYLYMYINSAQNELSAGITGALMMDGGYDPGGLFYDENGKLPAGFLISAEYVRSGGWTFKGELYPGATLELISLVSKFMNLTPPGEFPALTVEKLSVSFNSVTGRYAFSGAIAGRWRPDVLGGLDLSLKASVDIERRPGTAAESAARGTDGENMVLTGSLSGKFSVNKLSVGAGMKLEEKEATYNFTLGYGDYVLTGSTSWTGDKENRRQVISFTFGGVTLGSVVEYFANLARPGSGFHLEPPWDFLNSIDLSRFALTVDPGESSAAFTYAVNLNAAFIEIKTVGVKYIKLDGRDSVRLVLTGRFLEEEYREGSELDWDVLDDPPPAVPGKGPGLLSLRYLGIGQHIALRGASGFNSVSDVVRALQEQMKPVEDASRNPLDQSSGSLLGFSESSRWLVGLDMTLMDMLSLAAVFNDPDIYGLVISLSGAQAGSLAGLRFEILYKRVTADIGVFKAVFRMPEAFRQLQLGVVSVTLGVITVEIYTNGDFRVDLGFPKNRDFTDSFGLQVYVFTGHGGIYFGKLSGPTSSRVPVVSNGSFSPVLELGIGIAVGVGREFNSGPLKAGLYVELLAIFEGVLAWFHPNDAAQQTSLYYRVKAVAGIIGKLYGCVDFKIIKVSVSVEAYATVTLELESCEPAVVELDVGVEVRASVKILFININFSFGLNLHESFVIGEKSTPPWIAAGGAGAGPSGLAAAGGWRPRRRSGVETRALTRHGPSGAVRGAAAFRYGKPEAEGYGLVWGDAPVFPDLQIRNISLKLIPAFTMDNIGVEWENGAADPGAPVRKTVFLLSADNGIRPDGADPRGAGEPTVSGAAAADSAELALSLLIEAMFRWCISAKGLGQKDDITSGQLEDLYSQLNMPETAGEGFNFEKLSAFFDNNLVFAISAIPDGGDPADIGGTVFPMIPILQWESEELGSMDYDLFNQVGPAYEKGADEYFKKMVVNPPPGPPPASEPGASGQTISMAKYIFCDYFLMLARTAVQSAMDLLSRCRYPLSPEDSLAGIASCAKFKRVQLACTVKAGDNTEALAAFLGLTAAELRYLNPGIDRLLEASQPGTAINVELGITPQSVAVLNQNVALTEGLPLEIGAVACRPGSDGTLRSIADRFGMTGVMELFGPLPDGLTGMDKDPLLLRTGSVITISGYTYPNTSGLNADLTAAVFFVRLKGSAGVPYQPWYTEAIFALNQDKMRAYTGPLPAGVELDIPAALYGRERTLRYTTLAGDTAEGLGACFSLLQNFNADRDPGGEFGKFDAEVRLLNPGGPGPVIMPEGMTHSVEPLETLDSLWKKFFLDDLGALADRVQQQQGLLSPLAAANIPGVVYVTKSGDTPASVAEALNLTVEGLASLAGVISAKGLFKYSSAEPVYLEIRDIPAMDAEDILTELQSGEVHSRIGGMLSRFFLHGLRLPAPRREPGGPVEATGPMTGLYELTGQQVNGLLPDPLLDPENIRATVSFSEKLQKKWVAFYDSYTVGPEDTIDALEARHLRLGELNPAIRLKGRFIPGTIVLTGRIPKSAETGLRVRIKEKHLREGYPAEVLKPDILAPLSPMRLSEEAPKTYGFQKHILWQTPVPVALPGEDGGVPLAGSPSIWVFPQDLTARILAADGPTAPYRLKYRREALDDVPAEPGQYSWATLLKIELRRVRRDEAGGGFLTGTYEIAGADPAGRSLLFSLVQALPAAGGPDGRIYLLYETGAASAVPVGLSADDPEPGSICVIKTNLTTETASGIQGPQDGSNEAAPLEGEYFAAAESRRRFLLLLWECSVVGGGGFYLRYAGEGGKGLPDSVFASDGSGSVWLVFLSAGQSSGSDPDRRLYPFNNCAVVGTNLDPSSSYLFAEAAEGSEAVKLPALQPGNAGFDMLLKNPELSRPADPEQLTARRLYSLLGYKINGNGGFVSGPEAAPTSPTEAGEPGEPLSVRAARRRARLRGIGAAQPAENWRLHQVIPVSRFAAEHSLSDCPPLPSPLNDPYAGIAPGAEAPLSLWFTDVFGNVSAGCAKPVDCTQTAGGQLCLPVGYMDEVIGTGKWPGAVSTYGVSAPAEGAGAVLGVRTDFQPSSFMPGMSQSLESAGNIMAKQLQQYTRIYYQLSQKDVSFAIRTSLSQASGQEPDTLPFNGAPLRGFAAAACIWLSGAALLEQAFADTAAADTLDSISAYYGVSYDELANANLPCRVSGLFSAAALSTPRYAVFARGDSAVSLCERLSSMGYLISPPELLLEAENLMLPLRTGTALSIPPRSAALPASGASLADAAAGFGCTEGGFAAANADLRGLLAPGAGLSYQGLELAVEASAPGGPSQSLNDMAQRFIAEMGADSRTTGVDIAMANHDVKGIFNGGVAAEITDYIAAGGDTLLSNGSGAPKEALASLNTGRADIFEAGTPVYYSAESYPAEGTVEEFCKIYNLTPGQLFYHNRDLDLSFSEGVRLPGAVRLPPVKAAVTMPYSPVPQDSLETAANKFDLPGGTAGERQLSLARANGGNEGLFAPGKTVTVDRVSVVTGSGESFNGILEKFRSQGLEIGLDRLTAVIGGTSGLFDPAAVLICPPALLPQDPEPFSLEELSALYNVPALALASACCALTGIISKGVELLSSSGSVVTTEGDTLNSITARFNDLAPTSLEDVVLACAKAKLIRPGCNMLLPPKPAEAAVKIGGGGPKYPSAVFPVSVALEIRRSSVLIHPDFDSDGPVCRSSSSIPPYMAGSGKEGDPMRLGSFAGQFQEAFPSLRLATCKPSGELEGEAAGASSGPELRAVLFAEEGIGSVSVRRGVNYPAGSGNYFPRFFALRPLRNRLDSQQAVPVRPLNDDGTLGEAFPADYQGVDLEVWARRFLSEVELFLSAAYASPLWTLNGGRHRTSLDAVVSAKKQLCEAISKGIDYVLDTAPSPQQREDLPDPARESARLRLEQQLRVNLGQAYATGVILQFDARTVSPGLEKPARLCGRAKASVIGQEAGEGRSSGAETKFSITDAKTDLSTGDSYVNFLLSVGSEQLRQSLRLDLAYVFNELEYNIRKAKDVEGYEASDWLSFVLPLTEDYQPACFDIDLGRPVVPLPLRVYPENPQMVSQTAGPSKTAPHSIGESELWDYSFTYEHQDAAQDTLRLTVRINETAQASRALRAASSGPTLLESLAQYVYTAEKLWNILSRVTAHPDGEDDETLGSAVDTFAALVGGVAGSWSAHWTSGASLHDASAPSAEVYDYTVKLNPDAGGIYYSTLALSYDTLNPWPGRQAPTIACIRDGSEEIPLTAGEPSKGVCIYSFPSGAERPVPVYSRLGFRLQFRELNIVHRQNALSLASVSRNTDIFRQEVSVPTNPAFVYQTPQVGFADVTTPLLSWDIRFPFGESGSLADAVKDMLEEILGPSAAERELAVSVQYGYTLVRAPEQESAIVMHMPVLFKPCFKYAPSAALELAAALEDWKRANDPDTREGFWNFNVTVFSGIAGTPQLPVLTFGQLTTGIREDM